MRDGSSQLSLRSGMLRWNTFMKLRVMLSMRCWWTQEQRDMCPPFWARDAPHEAQLNPCLVTASGEPLDHCGCRRVNPWALPGVQPI